MEGYQSGLGYVSVGEERLREYGGVFSPQAAGEDDMCLLQEAAGLYRGREEQENYITNGQVIQTKPMCFCFGLRLPLKYKPDS